MKIRLHKGSLAESMDTVKEIEPSYEAIREYFKKDSHFPFLYDGTITVKYYAYDERIGWNTYVVCFDGNAAGFTDEPVDGGQ